MPSSRIVCLSTLITIMLSLSPATRATIINFDLRNQAVSSALDGSDTGLVMSQGLHAVFSSLVAEGSTSVFNLTSSSFGINSLLTSLDKPSLIDATAFGSEAVQVVFSEFVYLREITLSSFTTLEWASLLVSGQPELLLNGKTSAIDSYSFNHLSIPAGTSLLLSHASGNGFSLDSIRVETASLPEPTGLVLMLLVLGLLFLLRWFSYPAWPSGDG